MTYLLAPTVLRLAREELPARVRARFGAELRRSGSFAQVCMLGAQACLDAAGGEGSLGVLWSSRLEDQRAMRAVLDESLKRGEPAMPFAFMGMQPHLAGTLLAQRGLAVGRSAHVHLEDEDWPLLLSTAQAWLGECERVLLGRVEESQTESNPHQSDWCMLEKKAMLGAIRVEPAEENGSAVPATATDLIGRIAQWRAEPGGPLLLRGRGGAWRFTFEGSA
jgi:hypothetical protein